MDGSPELALTQRRADTQPALAPDRLRHRRHRQLARAAGADGGDALRRGPRSARRRDAALLRVDPAVDDDRFLERGDRLRAHELRARPGGTRGAVSAQCTTATRRSRAPPRSSSAYATRIPRACRAISTWMLEGLVATGEAALVPSLHPERQQRARRSPQRRRTAAAALAERFGAALDVTYRRRERSIGYKAGNIRDFCERWGALPRVRHRARRRQRHDAAGDAAPRAHHAGRAADRHPADAGHRPAERERLRAHLPVRHAARHALLHAGRGELAGRLRTVLGPQRHTSPGAFHRALRAAACCRARRRSAATCSATTSSKRC